MIKKRIITIFVAVFFLNLCTNNLSFAIDDTLNVCHYPDYSYEFCGKEKCEGFNRKLFIFNLKLNKYVLKPVNIVWASVMPKCAMDRLQNVYTNINFPVRLVSCALQKDFKGSKQEFLRFVTNTTIGVGGLWDPAKNKFKLEPRQEDMGQVLAHYNLKKGPYLVLPVVRGNVRDLIGQLLDYPLRPFSYIPIAGAIANTVFNINNTAYMQAGIKKVSEDYADPYEIAKQIHGFERFIKNENLDRDEVLNAKSVLSGNNIPVRDIKCNTLKPDVYLVNYNPQSPLIDSMRTALFRDKTAKESKWSELSVWNRNFKKKIKTSKASIEPNRPIYKYRYILQKNKTSPLAIIYPSIGEGIRSDHADVLAKILYDEGYSVVIEGSAFQWEFVKSMPKDYKPGLPYQDASYLRLLTSKILANLEGKKGYKFERKIVVGTSFGALTALFTAAQEEKENTLGVSKYISINPPIELYFAMRQFDRFSTDWKNDASDIKMRAAVAAEKVVKITQKITDKKYANVIQGENEPLPFNDEEAKLIMGFVMKQKLSDVVFSVEKASTCKKCKIYESVNKMGFEDYGDKYLFVNQQKASEQYEYETSLYSLAGFLRKNEQFKIYHTLDDYYVNPEQLNWLKKVTGDKTVLFSNGSHLGFLYRKEFMDEFLKDVRFEQKPALREL